MPPSRTAQPDFIEPMLATLTDQRDLPGPRGAWILERKFDGFRAVAFRSGRRTHLLSRNQKDLGAKFPEIVEALNAQPLRRFIIDGEIVAMYGRTISFQFLQQRLKPPPPDPPGSSDPTGAGGAHVAYFVFDLLFANGLDARSLPLLERKQLLKKAIAFDGPIRYTPHRVMTVRAAFEEACGKGWEGIIAKRADDPYISGRSKSWLKLKCEDRQEFIIGGFTDPQGSRIGLGALLVGYYERGALRYAGKVGTGFNTDTLLMLDKRFKPLITREFPFAPDPALPRRKVHWLKPKLIAEVEFSEWTHDGKLRHPRFLGLRPDKKPSEVVRERSFMSRTSATTIKIGRTEVRLSNLDKVLYPETGFTKGQMIDYYARIAPFMLPHLRDRPVSLKRYPDGVDGKAFYQKNCPAHRPEWIQTARVPRQDGSLDPTEYCLANDAASLVWLANLASIELHTQLFRMSDTTRPTMMVFDLDPGPGRALLDCLQVAQRLREALSYFKLECFIKTSGSKGAHLAIPLNTAVTFDATKTFARGLAEVLERDDPKRITTKMSKSQRAGKVFVDWSQNDQHKTTVCVYSMRARPRPTVSTPVTWDEVASAIKRKDASRLVFEADQVLQRVERIGDLFEPLLKLKQRPPNTPNTPNASANPRNAAAPPAPPPPPEARRQPSRSGKSGKRSSRRR